MSAARPTVAQTPTKLRERRIATSLLLSSAETESGTRVLLGSAGSPAHRYAVDRKSPVTLLATVPSALGCARERAPVRQESARFYQIRAMLRDSARSFALARELDECPEKPLAG
jgi:hypothetical protein